MKNDKNSMKNIEMGAFYMVLSSFFVALLGLSGKMGLQSSSLSVLMFLRFFIPFLILLPYFLYKHSFKNISRRKLVRIQLSRAFVVIIGQYSLFFYLTKANLVDATMLWNTSPIFMPIVSALLFKDKFRKLTWFSVIVGLVGVACVIKPTERIFDPSAIFGLIAGISVAISLVLYGHSRQHDTLDMNLFYFYALTSFISFGILILYNGVYMNNLKMALQPYFSFKGYALHFILLISFSTVGNQILRGAAYKYAKPAILGPLIYLSVLFSGIFDWYFFHNVPTFSFYIGAVLIVMSSIFRG